MITYFKDLSYTSAPFMNGQEINWPAYIASVVFPGWLAYN